MKTFIKSLTFFLLTFTLCNCNSINKNPTDNRISESTVERIGDIEKQLAGKSISFYLSHLQIPQICKDLYSNKIPISDDKQILALMDSLFTKNNETRPFYMLTLTKTMGKADGAYAEPLGTMAKSFVETRPKVFIDYFLNEPILTDKDFDEWAKTVTGEIQIVAENHEIKEADKVKKLMIENCSNCNDQEQQKLNNFALRVKQYCS